MVVALLVERLLPTADVRISNPAISKNQLKRLLLSTVLQRRK